MTNKYLYPALFDYAADGITVTFPDLPGCITCGWSDEEAVSMAKEAMALHLYDMEKSKAVIPQPIKLLEIQHEKNQSVVMIEVFMPPFRHEIENQAIKNI